MSKSLALPQLFNRFPDDAAAERWLVRQRWPDGMRCPICDADDVQARPTRKLQPYRGRVCRRDFSVKTATVMHGSHLDCRVWVIALYLPVSRPKGVQPPAVLGPGPFLQGYLAPVASHPRGLPHRPGAVPGAGRGG